MITSFMEKKQLKVRGCTCIAVCMYKLSMSKLNMSSMTFVYTNLCCIFVCLFPVRSCTNLLSFYPIMFPTGYQAIHSTEKPLSWKAHL